MHTHAADPSPGVGAAAKEVAGHARTLARLELATLELRRKAGTLGAGAGLGLAAGLLVLYALGFLFATVAVVLSIVLDAWLALLLVAVSLLALAALLGLAAVRMVRRGVKGNGVGGA